MSERVQSVDRAIDILTALLGGPKNLTEVCRATGLTKPTAHRLLSSLGQRGLVLKDPTHDNNYMLGPNLLPILQGVSLGLGHLGAIARPLLTQVRETTEETVTLHVQAGIERICIEEIRSPHALQYAATVGSRAPLHVGAAGKVLIAFLDDDQRERVFAMLPQPLPSITGETITDLKTLQRQLEQTRQRGWALSAGERISGASAVSVPIFAHDQLIAALSVLGPSTRLDEERLKGIAAELGTVADQVSVLLEGRDDGKGS
jgi:DNA-binding IclR family transcriptional regulator